MVTDIIYSSPDGFTCSHCGEKFGPGTLVNVFRWDNRMTLYCMKCLQKLGIDPEVQWTAEQPKDPRMKEEL